MKKKIIASRSSSKFYEQAVRMFDQLYDDISDINGQVYTIANYYYYSDDEEQKELLDTANRYAKILEDIAGNLYKFANIKK